MNANTDQPALLASVGGGLAVLGSLFPWTRAADLQYGIDGLGLLTGTLGLAVIGLAVLSRGPRGTAGLAGIGALTAGIGIWQFAVLGDAALPGVGLFLTTVAGAMTLLGVCYRHFEVGTAHSGFFGPASNPDSL